MTNTITVIGDPNAQTNVTGQTDTTTVDLTYGVYDTIVDANFGTGSRDSIQTVSLTDTGLAGQYSYTTIDSDALHSLTLTGVLAGVYVDAAAGARALSLTLDGVGPGYVSSTGTWLEDNTATQMSVRATGAASDIYIQANSLQSISFQGNVDLSLSEFVVGSSLKSITIGNSGNFTADLSLATDADINTRGAAGDMTLTLSAGQTYHGGLGDSAITVTGGHVLTDITLAFGSVALGESLAEVTFTTTKSHTLILDGTQASFGTDVTALQASISTANLDVIQGLHAGDVIEFAAATAGATVDAASSLAGVSGNVEVVRGIFSQVAQTFTPSAFGHATLVTYGTAGDFVSVVLTGVDHTLPATLSNHALTWT